MTITVPWELVSTSYLIVHMMLLYTSCLDFLYQKPTHDKILITKPLQKQAICDGCAKLLQLPAIIYGPPYSYHALPPSQVRGFRPWHAGR